MLMQQGLERSEEVGQYMRMLQPTCIQCRPLLRHSGLSCVRSVLWSVVPLFLLVIFLGIFFWRHEAAVESIPRFTLCSAHGLRAALIRKSATRGPQQKQCLIQLRSQHGHMSCNLLPLAVLVCIGMCGMPCNTSRCTAVQPYSSWREACDTTVRRWKLA